MEVKYVDAWTAGAATRICYGHCRRNLNCRYLFVSQLSRNQRADDEPHKLQFQCRLLGADAVAKLDLVVASSGRTTHAQSYGCAMEQQGWQDLGYAYEIGMYGGRGNHTGEKLCRFGLFLLAENVFLFLQEEIA